MNREAINPVDWGLQFNMNQAEITTGGQRHLRCSGQVSMVPDADAEMGIRVVAPDDMRGQIKCALENIDAILEKADMKRENIVSLRFFTTDMAAYFQNYDVYASWIAEAGIKPPQTLLQVAGLFTPDLMIEIEMEAVAD